MPTCTSSRSEAGEGLSRGLHGCRPSEMQADKVDFGDTAVCKIDSAHNCILAYAYPSSIDPSSCRYNRESGDEPYFTLPRMQSIARQVGRQPWLFGLITWHGDGFL